jgi:hypothetical protein
MPTSGSLAELPVRDLGAYWLVGDRLIAKIMGGSESAPESGGDGGEGGTEAGGGGEGESEEESEEEPEEQEGQQQPAAKRKADREFRERTKRRQAEQDRDRLQQQLEELTEKDKTDLERANGRATKAEQRVNTLEPALRKKSIEVAFMIASNGDGNKRKPIPWVDARDALTLAMQELSDLDVDDDGEVDQEAVQEVVDTLAKRKSHLVRKEKATTTPSGGNVGAGDQPPAEKTKEELAKTYGALRTRI